ncbi:MAG: cytochrome bc complex cytochrome b subunit [Gemmataceae bacterium]|nr:cytochrome bc complex cytochrome b subunit [Gemmataceae bacterium]
MPGRFSDWLDHRIGHRKLIDALLLEHIPGGARWRYVWGSTLAFVFMIQLITGILLMTSYSASDTSAWASVHYIQYQMDFGWLIRGLHHYGSQTMMVLIGMHMLQVVIAGAHLPPRELNWWLGLALLGVTFGLGLTGYLLPWDQKGYWATRVATNIASKTPGIGEELQRFLVGGPDYGNHTLTRFFAFHVGLLPALFIILLILHLTAFRRHGVTYPRNSQGSAMFWPDQAFRDMIACLIVFGIMLALVIFGGHGNAVAVPEDERPQGWYEELAKAGQKGWGANLDAPADRDTPDYPARPEWYFLFLFQLLKYFPGDQILVGTFYIPNGVMALLFLLPLFGFGLMRKFGHFLGILVVVALLGAVGVLTLLAKIDDSPDPLLYGLIGNKAVWEMDPETGKPKLDPETGRPMLQKDNPANDEKVKKAADFQHAVHEAEIKAKRAAQLGMAGVPVEGGRDLIRNDPLTKGYKLFETNCAVCHRFTPAKGDPFGGFTKGKFTASDLGGFGSAEWIRSLLTNPGDDRFFGLTELDGMKDWRKGVERTRKRMGKEAVAQEEKDFDMIARWLADQARPKEKRDPELDKTARAKFDDGDLDCLTCHTIDRKGDGAAPDFTDYGSHEWIRFMIMNPGHKLRHGLEKNQMPYFRNLDGPGAEVYNLEFHDALGDAKAKVIPLSDIDRELIIRWMTRDDRVVFGGRPVAGPPKRE